MLEYKTIYIAGPMTGIPDYNYPKFHDTAKKFRAMGFVVESPAEGDEPESKTWEGYMRRAISKLIKCDAVVFLNGWENSKGARLEMEIAKNLNMEIMCENMGEFL